MHITRLSVHRFEYAGNRINGFGAVDPLTEQFVKHRHIFRAGVIIVGKLSAVLVQYRLSVLIGQQLDGNGFGDPVQGQRFFAGQQLDGNDIVLALLQLKLIQGIVAAAGSRLSHLGKDRCDHIQHRSPYAGAGSGVQPVYHLATLVYRIPSVSVRRGIPQIQRVLHAVGIHRGEAIRLGKILEAVFGVVDLHILQVFFGQNQIVDPAQLFQFGGIHFFRLLRPQFIQHIVRGHDMLSGGLFQGRMDGIQLIGIGNGFISLQRIVSALHIETPVALLTVV